MSNVIQFVPRGAKLDEPKASELRITATRTWPPYDRQTIEMMIAISPYEGKPKGKQ